jgi:bifunctional non-homologous end joining protein LigD
MRQGPRPEQFNENRWRLLVSLESYRRKRRFQRTPEPEGAQPPAEAGRRFVVQKHAARRLHYDLRLELDGVLKSWAVPKGPCLDPYEKRLAVQVEDHPLEYGAFEGTIPAGEYGAGTVLLWDRGTWAMLDESEDARQMYAEGKLKIRLEGEKLRGGWMLVRMNPKPGESAINWLLIKERDEHARSLADYDVLESQPESVESGGSIAEVQRAQKRAWSSTSGELIIAKTPAEALSSKPVKRRRRIETAGAIRATMPPFVEPQLATLALKAPEGPRWIHEIKLDGYRVLCRIDEGRIRLFTRRQQDWTARFPELARAAAELPVRQAWLDGELVALLSNGASSFPALQQALSTGQTGKLVYFVFDLLYLEGYDFRGASLEDRKRLLAELLAGVATSRIQYCDHLDGDGPEFFRQCGQMGLEGIVSKRRDRPYRSGRTGEWLKLKCVQREEFVIGGYSLPSTAQRKGLGALLVGYYSPEGELIYAGRVGTGFSEQVLLDLRQKLDALAQESNPFDLMERERIERGTRWVRPELVAQLEFGSWTAEGLLRYPSFQGLREDRAPRSVVREPPEGAQWIGRMKQTRTKAKSQAVPAAAAHPRWQEMPTDQLEALAHLQLTHADRVLYPEQGLTKLGLAAYYAEIAQWALPYLIDRPVSLLRCPEGHQGPCFFQKHAAAGTPPQLERIAIREKAGKRDYLVIRDLAGLLSTVQMGVLELHPWGSRTDRLDRPDRMIFDLDPDPELPWSQVVDAARHVHGLLEELGLVSFVKTTGGKGLHLVVPLERRHSWDEVKEFSQSIAQLLAGQEPRRYTASASKPARRGRIYIDYLRNVMGATAVAAYSTRARAGATVSTPLAWDELTAAIKPDHFRVDNIPSRLAALEEDPWAAIDEVRQSITARIKRRVGRT